MFSNIRSMIDFCCDYVNPNSLIYPHLSRRITHKIDYYGVFMVLTTADYQSELSGLSQCPNRRGLRVARTFVRVSKYVRNHDALRNPDQGPGHTRRPWHKNREPASADSRLKKNVLVNTSSPVCHHRWDHRVPVHRRRCS